MSVSMYKNPLSEAQLRPPALDALLRQEPFIAPAPIDLSRRPSGPPLVTRRPAWWPVASHAKDGAK